ncbi:hypothetical protein AVEN_97436-1 [Araneus ventricosus]|uniref:Uncharacterized protein n=1 Tax=Araneus ventricosus TaxID=182803 RepID=A0A4Y2EJ23_ARAVE|nr:hypothetical protein AVEN_97436-1 [Araneus ventricosus]
MNFLAFLYPSLNKRRSIGVSDATASPYRIPHLQPGLTDNPPQKSEYGLRPARPSSSFLRPPLLFLEPKTSLSPTTNKIPVTPTKGPLYAASNPSISFQERGNLSEGQAQIATQDEMVNDPFQTILPT